MSHNSEALLRPQHCQPFL